MRPLDIQRRLHCQPGRSDPEPAAVPEARPLGKQEVGKPNVRRNPPPDRPPRLGSVKRRLRSRWRQAPPENPHNPHAPPPPPPPVDCPSFGGDCSHGFECGTRPIDEAMDGGRLKKLGRETEDNSLGCGVPVKGRPPPAIMIRKVRVWA